jgi:monoamine oxidase
MLTRIDNTPFHYFELDHPTAAACRGRDARARFARRVLADHFGHRALTDLSIPAATDWASDPFSGGSWSVVPPGLFGIREALKPASGGCLWFAGEALSRAQWGTVGGAWQEGERAAEEAIAALRNKHRRTASTC